MLPPARRPRVDRLNVDLLTGSAKLEEADNLDTVWPTLSATEKAALLSDNRALERLVALNPTTQQTPPRPAVLHR